MHKPSVKPHRIQICFGIHSSVYILNIILPMHGLSHSNKFAKIGVSRINLLLQINHMFVSKVMTWRNGDAWQAELSVVLSGEDF